ncbi:MAG: tyrosine-type recombinase/integrase, partial [Candidatus Altiarchaeota archaeon]|nr:tyrosine-type recombinase/integrase [Candidatus Altiarchaeota archaeon]
QFSNEKTHERCTALSTKQRNYTDAMKVACNWLQNGLPSREGRRPVEHVSTVQAFMSLLEGGKLGASELDRIAVALTAQGLAVGRARVAEAAPVEQKKTRLVSFLENFWTYETSPYIQDKLIHKQRIGKRHCYDSKKRISYWKDFFRDDAFLEDVSTVDLKAFERSLAEKGLSSGTLNHILIAGKTAFKWAVANKLLDEDPCLGLTRYGKETKERDILSEAEAKKLFEVRWSDERARVASLVAMTCGLRMGEVLALRMCDVAETRLYVRHSWSVLDGLKSPKNGKVREVPLLPSVKAALAKLATENPFGWDKERFIFYGSLPDKPVVENVLVEGFKDALARSGVSEQVRKERNIVFHSWRHYYAKVVADRVDQRQAQLALGHMTAAMTAYYADHKTEADLVAIERAVGDAFSSSMNL